MPVAPFHRRSSHPGERLPVKLRAPHAMEAYLTRDRFRKPISTRPRIDYMENAHSKNPFAGLILD
jgi:hypothetical protein